MSRPKIVLLGMLTKIPVGGVMWLVRQYAVGFGRLGYDVYYVEAHGRVPSTFMEDEHDDATSRAVAFLADQMARNGMDDRWAFHAVHDGGRCYGLSRADLDRLYREAELIVNLHGGTVPLEEHAASGRLVYLGTDPVELELELDRGERKTIEFLEPHVAFFTWGLNYGNSDCLLPWSERFPFVPSPPPVVLDLWQETSACEDPEVITTVGNWRQHWREVRFRGEVYTWSKHHEFLKILDLPRLVDQELELALSSYDEADRRLLEHHGWAVRPGLEVSSDPDSYRSYVAGSRGELTVAKDQNVRLRTGWFSERSATYLAAGRPVIQQDTGFGNVIPTGTGAFSFSDLDGAVAAVEALNANYAANRQAATDLAREFFNYDVVLGDILDHLGMGAPGRTRPGAGWRNGSGRSRAGTALPVGCGPVPTLWRGPVTPVVSVVTVTVDDLALTRTGLESLLAHTAAGRFEVVVVDTTSSEETRRYLSVLAARNGNVKAILRSEDPGASSAIERGLEAARAEIRVLVDLATAVGPEWLAPVTAALQGAPAGASRGTIAGDPLVEHG